MTWKKRIMSIALCLCALLCAASVRADAANTADTHTHLVCGGTTDTTCTHAGEKHTSSQPWTAWNGTDTINYDDNGVAYIYLSDDVTLENANPLTVSTNQTLYLCLNRHSIKMKYDGGYRVISVESGNLILCDCKGGGTITQDTGNNYKDRGVYVQKKYGETTPGTFIMYGGSITGNNGGVEVKTNCTFTLYGGTITKNELESGNSATGGGVCNYGEFTMYGGTISGNKVTDTDSSDGASGGGVYNDREFIMFGGEITGNTATGNGGGVYNNGTFTMSDGSITNNVATNNGGGVYNGGTFEISDDITIKDNKKIDSDNKSTDNNVCLSSSYRAITIAGELKNTDPIGVTTQATLSDDTPYIDITKENYNTTLVNAAKSKLTYTDKDGNSHEIVTRNNGKILAVCNHSFQTTYETSTTQHWQKCKNCDTIKENSTAAHTDFDAWHNGTNGHYHKCSTCGYTSAEAAHDWADASCAAPKTCSDCGATQGDPLTHPICGLTTCTHTDKHTAVTWTPWDGKGSIQYTNNAAYVSLSQDVTLTSALTIENGNTLYLCLNGHNLKMSGNRVINVEGGTFILCNCKDTGAITQANKNSKGMGVGLSNNGAFTMYGGSITGNKVGVSVGSGCTFTMYGGSITDNIAENYGAGVKNEGTFTMHGGEISKNKNTVSNGGGVFVGANATFTMSGGKIISNTAEGDGGGGVYNQGTFTMSDGEISGNTTTFGGGVRNYGTFTMSGGSITDNTAANNGGGVNNYSGTFKVSGDVIIKDNKKGSEPNNVYLPDNSTIALAGALGKDASIYVTTPSAPSSGKFINITAPNSNKDLVTAAKDRFVYDNSSSSNPIEICTYTVTEDETTTVQLRACKHNYNSVKWTPNTDASTHSGKCANCDTIATDSHIYNEEVADANKYLASAATCTAKAMYYKSCVCGEKGTATFEYGNSLGHTGGAATCTEQAVCERCHQPYGDSLGHDYVSHVKKAATCTEIGWNAYETCNRCNYTTYREIPALNHDFSVRLYDKDKHWDKCSRCDETDGESDHDLVHHDAKAPTPTEKGWYAYDACNDCDYTTKKEIPATCSNHYWRLVPGVAATCTTTGTQEHFECDNCENKSVTDGVYKIVSDTDLILAKLAHSGGAATCTEQAVCGVCGTPYGAVLGHDWSAWVVTTPATENAPGVETRTCTRDAAHTETRSIPKLSTAVYTVSEDTEIKQIKADVVGLSEILGLVENKQLIDAGKSVGVSLTVKNTASSGVSEKIKEKLAGSNLVGLRLELTVEKTVTENGAVVERENIPDTGVLLKTTITLPAELQGKSGYVVYRLHGDAVHVLTETPNANDECITVSADKTQITICARLYSEYVIAYQSSGSSGGGYHPASSAPVKTTSANTGDAGVLLYGVTAALSLTGTAWLGTKGKKH